MYEDMEDRIYQHHRLRVLRKRKEYEKYGLVPNYEELRTDPSYSDLRQRVEKARVIIKKVNVFELANGYENGLYTSSQFDVDLLGY